MFTGGNWSYASHKLQGNELQVFSLAMLSKTYFAGILFIYLIAFTSLYVQIPGESIAILLL